MTKPLILIVDDDADMRATIRNILELEYFEVIEAANANEMYDKLDKNNVSLILLDLILQEVDGLEIMRELKPKIDIPVIMLTGKSDVIDKIVGLEIGADDYITKPFHAKELLARIKSVIRRSSKNPISKSTRNRIYSFCDYKLDVYAHTLTSPEGMDLNITSNEYTILTSLINSAGRVLSREQLLNHLDSRVTEHSPYDRSLDVLIAKIRKKIDDSASSPKCIRTIRQAGYMFIADVEKTDGSDR